jgi:flagellar biosynthesis anti-sigma factor FlgM
VKISGRKGKESGNVVSRKTGEIQGKGQAGSAGTVGGATSSGAPSLAISDQGRLVSEAHRALDALPEVRIEKVGRIQAAMDNGAYRVEGQQVADKMVSDAVRELRNRTR